MLLWGSWQRGTSVSLMFHQMTGRKAKTGLLLSKLVEMLGAWAASEVQHPDTPS